MSTVAEPDWVSPPGDTIADLLEERSWTQAEFALRMGVSKKHANQLISGEATISEGVAMKLERVLGSTARFWLNREAVYRAALAKREEIESLRSEVDWLKELPIKSMRDFGWIQTRRDKAETVRDCLRYFGVGSVEAWREWSEGLSHTAYRMSDKARKEFGAIAAWLRQGELLAAQIECAPYSVDKFKERLTELRALTVATDPTVFVPRMTELCSEAGVAVVLTPAPRGCPASGATRWLAPEKALLMLSLRYRTNDQLWFSFFHEAGHIVRHGKRKMFLELTNHMHEEEEAEADQFAASLLIPPKTASQLSELGMSTKRVQEFAKEIGVAPGIVVGRMQHEGHIPHSHLNRLKVRYVWER